MENGIDQPTPIKISLDKLRNPADNCVVRASVFLGISENASETDPPISHILDDRVKYSFIPDDVSRRTSAHFVEEFKYWVIGNALRELVEGFSGFLLQCRTSLTIMETGVIDTSELAKISSKFESGSISDQYNEIGKIIDASQEFGEMLESLRSARNCLAHRRGVVARRDVNTAEGALKVRWCFLGTFIRGDVGVDLPIDNQSIGDGMHLDKGGEVIVRLTWKERSIPIGSQIRLTRHDLGEICFGISLATDHVIAQIRKFAHAHGIPNETLEEKTQTVGDGAAADQEPKNMDRDD